ncbi:galactosyl transferase GMA12/MNN10 family-domain-containing protein [Gilbertella persicaria]|uniref:galactosyl transferase GMA12/MNN10 family-domain-containing protein n=1 Tax=Gilbertella persicaria TaxID=101096 RepID=UPI00221FC6D6|nr:galactosyl transferase GMA12/MNN10 family-domain-containing protein [Gilbertella persicaria]KAI8050135.1 galactosyl transferase GMA12/MNN10 family-domain-containing protein [Gilbertella persicaria]
MIDIKNRRQCLGISVLCVLFLFLLTNIQFLSRDRFSRDLFKQQVKHNYLIVIGTEAQFESRRKLIRANYFGIQDNLKPITLDHVKYQFLVYGGTPHSDTPERRLFETEKMEFDDISLLPAEKSFNQDTVVKWLGKKEYDYVIIQDPHSFVDIHRLIQKIETEPSVKQWGNLDQGVVVIGLNNGPINPLATQLWENSIESVDTSYISIQHVYQDQDFTNLVQLYQVKPLSSLTGNQSIAVITSSFIYDKCMEPSGTRASLNKRDYATRHGYAFVARSSEFAQQAMRPDQRRTVWGKIDAIQKVLPKYEWLLWLDMDAVVMNQAQSVESLLHTLESYYNGTDFNEIDFIVVRPGTDKMINAGVFLIKNTAWSAQFLRDIQARQEWYRQGPSYEQGAMWDVMREEKYIRKTLFLDRQNHIFNTFPKFYEEGDFIVHFAPDKCPNAATLKGLAAADKIKSGQKITSAELI